ncbi:MAG: deoxynucleoside kinase [Candidatus Acidiferrales bacterium]
MQRVEICGGIAAGKTSLARCLTHNGAGRLIEERFREVPFWEKFYAAPQVYAFEKNVSFLLFHADSIGDIMQLNDQRLAICDFAMFQDLAYASLGAASADLHIVRPIYDKLIKRIGFPSLIVKLNCAPETQLERIRRRARPQEKSIEMSYLVELGAKIEEDLIKLKEEQEIAVVEIDTDETDFVTNPQATAISFYIERHLKELEREERDQTR